MQLSERWLREWVDPAVTTQQLADTLTMAGLEVDSLRPAAPAFSGVVAARITSHSVHPDAETLHVCSMDDGSGAPVTVVCGAHNVRSGMVAALAMPGAQLPGDVTVEAKTLAGVESSGMLCSQCRAGAK